LTGTIPSVPSCPAAIPSLLDSDNYTALINHFFFATVRVQVLLEVFGQPEEVDPIMIEQTEI